MTLIPCLYDTRLHNNAWRCHSEICSLSFLSWDVLEYVYSISPRDSAIHLLIWIVDIHSSTSELYLHDSSEISDSVRFITIYLTITTEIKDSVQFITRCSTITTEIRDSVQFITIQSTITTEIPTIVLRFRDIEIHLFGATSVWFILRFLVDDYLNIRARCRGLGLTSMFELVDAEYLVDIRVHLSLLFI